MLHVLQTGHWPVNSAEGGVSLHSLLFEYTKKKKKKKKKNSIILFKVDTRAIL